MDDLPLKPICDFCNAPDPVWAYECPDYEAYQVRTVLADHPVVLHGVSEGRWAACATCAALVEDKDWVSLRTRCLDGMRLPLGFRGAANLLMARVHQPFIDKHTGKRTRIERKER